MKGRPVFAGATTRQAGARIAILLIQFFHPDVADENFRDGFDLDAEVAGLVVGGIRVVVDIHGHELAVDDVHADGAAGDDGVLVPIVCLHEFAEIGAVTDVAHQAFFRRAKIFHDLPAPGDDAHGRVFGIELAGVNAARPEIRLRAGHHPIEIHRADVGGDGGADGSEPGDAGEAAILKTAAAAADDFDFEFQREIPGLHVAIGDVGIAAGILAGGFADDGAVFHAPEFRIAVPALEAHAVEERLIAVVVVEIERGGLGEAHDEPGGWRIRRAGWRRGVRLSAGNSWNDEEKQHRDF